MKNGRFDQVDLKKEIRNKDEYEKLLTKYQLKLLTMQHLLRERQLGVLFVFEGWDAAGKGGAIKRAVANLDPRGVRVWPIAAPAPHEKRYHYMQRFWRKIPQYGEIAIFDRSWYGRVLVERVEKLAEPEEWKRAYKEINDFEKMLTEDRYMVEKFWLHISKEEQLKRFKKRAGDPLKQWKITDEDWRNREKWDQYVTAAEEMFEKTDTKAAPWHIIPANSKAYARIAVIRQMATSIERHLVRSGMDLKDIPDPERRQK
ncbi:UDP-galactose-lipid carrier transferase [Sporolactobacillus sp. CPB3-1]|uniref:UDP-galactose-lipid carrier transferase n=1 Tax=Sporolactobacillus mangiferae TaxID=2940498 RepID=A0ABT0M8L3_9BACL|nr:UDP-galactose-lipid carrier transferase [Sporolactobacillus mangiferae]MCL1631222.1 UDP-galactose-lipid carrier transferase [Sporolactobacillus mangiferae]